MYLKNRPLHPGVARGRRDRFRSLNATSSKIRSGLNLIIQHIYCIMDLVPISGKAIVKRLKQNGWTVKSQSGSHVKLENEFAAIVIVPVHGNKDLGKGLVKKIEKETGVRLI